MISGSLLIDKEVGLTSRQEVNNVSRVLKEKKAGHIGTLDPFADGLLIVLLGKATKISQFLEGMDKTYLATLSLGSKTDTGDNTGNKVFKMDVPILNKNRIEEVFKSFLGIQKQVPPMYSAIKINGKELYKYAREGVEIARHEREINIYELKLLNFSENEITFISKVSKGTYIRTLAEDIAERLGTVGHLSKLTRLQIGPYSLDNAKKSSEVSEKDLIKSDKMLSYMKQIKIDDSLKNKVYNGAAIHLDIDDEMVLLKDDVEPIAVYKKDGKGSYICVRGLR